MLTRCDSFTKMPLPIMATRIDILKGILRCWIGVGWLLLWCWWLRAGGEEVKFYLNPFRVKRDICTPLLLPRWCRISHYCHLFSHCQ
jgi:hypothetical protein